MWTAVIAVLGTLAGGLATASIQARADRSGRAEERAARREERAAAHQDQQIQAVESLVKALNDHRAAMVRRAELRLEGAAAARIEKARDITRATRSQISVPLASVSVRAPSLAAVAGAAARAAYDLRYVASHDDLEAARVAAGRAVDLLIESAAALFRWPTLAEVPALGEQPD